MTSAVREAPDEEASRSRARARRCRFTRTGDLWTLEGDCAITKSLELPDGVSLEGQGKTISLTGDAERFASVGVRLRSGTVRNLTIDGRDLTPSRSAYLAALVISGPGGIENTTVTGIRFGDGCATGAGIEIGVFDGERVDLENVTVAGIDGAGIILTGEGFVTIAESRIQDAVTGVQVMNAIEAAIAGTTTENVRTGIGVTGRAVASIERSAISGDERVASVIDSGIATIGNLTIVRFRRHAGGRHVTAAVESAVEGPTPRPITTPSEARVHPFPRAGSP